MDYTLIFRIEDDESIGERSRRQDPRAVVHGRSYYTYEEKSPVEYLVRQIAPRDKSGMSARGFKEYDERLQFPRPIELEREYHPVPASPSTTPNRV